MTLAAAVVVGVLGQEDRECWGQVAVVREVPPLVVRSFAPAEVAKSGRDLREREARTAPLLRTAEVQRVNTDREH